jgi:hypothetical protein
MPRNFLNVSSKNVRIEAPRAPISGVTVPGVPGVPGPAPTRVVEPPGRTRQAEPRKDPRGGRPGGGGAGQGRRSGASRHRG